MAGKKNIRQDNRKRPNVSERNSYVYIAVMGIILSYASFFLDETVNSTFKNIEIQALGAIFGILTNFGIVIIIFLAIPAVLLYKKDKKKVNFLVLAFISAFLISFILKLIIMRQRPVEAFTYPLINIVNYSFPSMHSMIVFALLPLLAYFFPSHRNYWVILAVLVAFTRVYFGFHYLSDVVFGILSGYLIGRFLLSKCIGGHDAKPKRI